MAFNQPLEADNVGGNNLLVSLVTGPVLGSIMWLIGDENDNNKEDDAIQRGIQDMMLDDDDDKNWETRADGYDTQQQHRPLPRLVRSDVSVAGDGGEQPMPRNYAAASLYKIHNDNKSSRAEEKKLSWSENLVEYMDESVRHDPPPASLGSQSGLTKPIKSAMTRSNPIRTHVLAGDAATTAAGGSEEKEHKIRYLPNGLDKAHNGLIMPTRPMGSSDLHGGGIESPQWGWYTNITPPTPEMYNSRSSLKHSDKSDHSTVSAASSDTAHFEQPVIRGPNRVFQGLKAGSNRPPVGWPSVPL